VAEVAAEGNPRSPFDHLPDPYAAIRVDLEWTIFGRFALPADWQFQNGAEQPQRGQSADFPRASVLAFPPNDATIAAKVPQKTFALHPTVKSS